MNIFSTIWKKAYKNGESALKLADDLGGFKGRVKVTPYDPITGQKFQAQETDNLLVNMSKSTIVQLISQGTSPWKGVLDPTKLKVSRMRFGNNNPTASPVPNKLNYYDFYEVSSRRNVYGATVINEGFNPTNDIIQLTMRASSGNYDIPYCQATLNPYAITVPKPPSHGTLVIELYKASELVETITFANSVYTRQPDGMVPTKMLTVAGKSLVSTPDDPTRIAGTEYTPTAQSTNTRLIYSYQIGFQGWKLILDEIDPSVARFDQIQFKFKIGANNVINSIVPQTGINKQFTSSTWAGQMAELSGRYYPVSGQKDYYDILSNPEYRDSESDYVDDFSVTFGVNMAGNLGNNGITDGSSVVRYKEAFLFNGYDDMFSHVVLPSTFDKNNTNAFFISWSILAPIN